MLQRARAFVRRRREAREAKRLEEGQHIVEGAPAGTEHERQKLSGRGAQPITPKRKW
jgi:hypothetical protein